MSARRAKAGVPGPAPAGPVVVVDVRQRRRPVDRHALAGAAHAALLLLGRDAELGIHVVGAREMERVNRRFLGHEGSTDVITFDHGSTASRLHGELFVCVDDAAAQAREFGTTWPREVVRYVVHGLLHLCGHDDLAPAPRRAMKREENRLVRRLEQDGWPGRVAPRRRRHG